MDSTTGYSGSVAANRCISLPDSRQRPRNGVHLGDSLLNQLPGKLILGQDADVRTGQRVDFLRFCGVAIVAVLLAPLVVLLGELGF
jgi:hypothetical protein